MNRQSSRSARVPCRSRGNQASGTETERPSLSSTLSVSSLMDRLSALGISISTLEVVMPCLQQSALIIHDNSLDPSEGSSCCTARLGGSRRPVLSPIEGTERSHRAALPCAPHPSPALRERGRPISGGGEGKSRRLVTT